MDTKALPLNLDGLSNSGFGFHLSPSANEMKGNALTQPVPYHILIFELCV